MDDYSASDVKSWLSVGLEKENLEHFSVELTGQTEKGSGYVADVIFVHVTGTDKQKNARQYDLVLKCSKSSAALKEQLPSLYQVYVREIYLYEKVFPSFRQFELNRGIERPFNSVPKSYGVFNTGDNQIVIMQNLKKIGYDLWDSQTPLTRKHIDLVMQEYAKFHAISVAMEDQEPEKFEKLKEGMKFDVFRNNFKSDEFVPLFEKGFEEIHDILENHVDNDILQKFLKLKDQMYHIFYKQDPKDNELRVITHGDCWNNNFMFKHTNGDKCLVSDVAILDWQISRYNSPILDLSYFLFSCISSEDIQDMTTILKNYHNSLLNNLLKLGSNLEKRYSWDVFLKEWKKFGKFGAFIFYLALKTCYTDKDKVPDMRASAENGEDVVASFEYKVTDEEGYRKRVLPVVEYIVKEFAES